MAIFYGACDGGPYHRKRLAHGRAAFRVTYDRYKPMRTVPGYAGEARDDLVIGVYVFHPMTEKWHWFADIKAGPITPTDYAVWITKEPEASEIANVPPD